MDPDDSHIWSNEAMRRVGWLLAKWGQLETKLSWGIYSLTPEVRRKALKEDSIARTLMRMLADWENAHQGVMAKDKAHMRAVRSIRASIKAEAETRNVIAHGLAYVVTNGPQTCVVCYERYHESVMIDGKVPPAIAYDLIGLALFLHQAESFIREVTKLNELARQVFLKSEPDKELGERP